MRPFVGQTWLTEFALPIASVILVSLCAYAVWRQRWLRTRPILSIYVWFLAITSLALLLVAYLLRTCPTGIYYTICRIYTIGSRAITIFTCFFSVAAVYEFLFRAADRGDRTRDTAVAGFAITTSLILAVAFLLPRPAGTDVLGDATGFVFGMTALALIPSGIFILAVKKARSLVMGVRLTVVFAALVLHDLISLSASFALRGIPQVQTVVSDLIWIAFAMLLYWALKKGPELPRIAEA
jgi:hypothetical protein